MAEQNKIRKSGNMQTSPSGTSGTEYSGHRFFEEYLDKLTQTDGAEVWDEMRRSDDKVIMLLRAVKNPILSARWFVAPSDDEEESKEIASFVEHVLMKDMGTEDYPKTFEKFKREALSSVEFGYALFEITNKIVIDDPEFGSYVGIKGLDWRSPKTIEEWYIARSGELEQVRQIDNSENGGDFFIPGKFILHIAADMEGDNYEGISMLRPIYGNWVRKDFLRKINMIGFERAATGVPVGQIPKGQENSPAQAILEDALSRFVNHERQYLVHPEGYDITSLKIEHDGAAVSQAIKDENVGMSQSFLANFLELGMNGGGGAFALGTDLSDLFLSGIEVYANAVITPVNSKLIPALVKANFGKQRKYPQLKIEGINDKAGKEFAEVLKMLGEAGLIQVTERLKESVHKKFKLPDYDHDFIEPVAPVDTQLSEIDYKLTEKSTSKAIEVGGKGMTATMQTQMEPRAEKLVSDMMAIWRNAPRAKRMEQVNKLVVPGKADYKKVVSNILAEAYVQATADVKTELSGDGLKLAEQSEIKNLPAESKAAGASQADLIVESQDADLRKNLFFSFTSKADVLPTEAQMNANLLSVVEKYLTGPSMRAAGPNAIANAVNLARNAVYQQKEVLSGIESFIFTNPSPEAPICKELQNRVLTKEEYITSSYLPPLHHYCNSYIRAQLIGRKGNKPLSPAGLTIQGSDSQITAIKKSITL